VALRGYKMTATGDRPPAVRSPRAGAPTNRGDRPMLPPAPQSPHMTRAVLFDLDDTLVRYGATRSDAAALFRAGAERVYAYLTAHELPMSAFEPFLRRQWWLRRRLDWTTWLTGGEPDARKPLRRMCREFGLQRDESSLAKLGWLWFEPLAETAHVAADVLPTLRLLRDSGLRLGLVANTTQLGAVIDQHLSDLGLLEFLPTRAYSSDVGARKPHPHPFLNALEQLGVDAGETVYVSDDLKSDLIGAHRLGMTTVLLSMHPPRGTRYYANHVIEHLGELREVLELPAVTTTAENPIPPLQVEQPALATP
jgi:FMN phosphatase YigB (HAD superfamily)